MDILVPVYTVFCLCDDVIVDMQGHKMESHFEIYVLFIITLNNNNYNLKLKQAKKNINI